MKTTAVLDNRYLLNTFVNRVAAEWHDLGIELKVENLDNYKKVADPTKEMYKMMLQEWLSKQNDTKLSILQQFKDAMEAIDLIAEAEKFREKASEAFHIDWPPDIN